MTAGLDAGVGKAAPGVSTSRAWWLAIRPKTLPAAFIPVLVGAACALSVGHLSFATTSVALMCALLLQVGSNFANDVFDYEKGADNEQRVGPERAVAQGWIAPATMKRATWLVLALAFALGLYLTSVGGWPILALGLAAIVSAVAYTGGPYPLGYNGLGELFVFLFFGLTAVCGTAFLNAGYVPVIAWWLALPVGSLTANILVVNNVRDFETDATAGKRTLVVRLGRPAGVIEYGLLLGLAYSIPAVVWLTGHAQVWILLPWLTLPLAARCMREVSTLRAAHLNQTLARTAQLLVVFGLLVSCALVWDSLDR